MYTEFLKALAEIAEHLDKAVKIGSDGSPDGLGMPTPYIYGSLEVRLEGEIVGYFDLEDEYVLYREKAPEAQKTTVESPPEGLKTTVESEGDSLAAKGQ